MKILSKTGLLVFSAALLLFPACQQKQEAPGYWVYQLDESDSIQTLYEHLSREFEKLRPQVIMPAENYLEYPYLIPAGFYKQMWDWDGFFIGNHLASLDSKNGKYLKYWALNFLKAVDTQGYVPGCITTDGPRPIFGRFAIKPFLSQGAYFAAVHLQDFNWIAPHYETLKVVLQNREAYQKDQETGLFFWEIAMQSGADNNPVLNYYQDDDRRFLACDINTWQYREYLAMAQIAKALENEEDVLYFNAMANTLKNKIEQYLWFEDDQSFYNIELGSLEPQRRVSYSNFVPLMANIATPAQGKAMISRYLLNEEHLLAPYGLRTLSKTDPDYNNKNVIVPFSNWQGPVWPIANYIYAVGMVNYGFQQEAAQLAAHQGAMILKDIYTYGSMHENYHADTGAPLAPTAEQSEHGVFTGFVGWNLLTQNMLEGAMTGSWMTLSIKKARVTQR